MRPACFALLTVLFLPTPAPAMVGNAPAAPADLTRHLVMIVGSHGTFCSGATIARDLILTAAHCVQEGSTYKLIELRTGEAPQMRDIARIVRHPNFSMATLNAHRATADLALLKLAAPLPDRFVPIPTSGLASVAAGDRFTVAGFGVAVRGDGRTSGVARSAALIATGQPGTLQIRLMDETTANKAPGRGACTGDSGAPVFAGESAARVLIGVVSWSTGANNAAGCGGLTGVTPLTRYRSWLLDTAKILGAKLVP